MPSIAASVIENRDLFCRSVLIGRSNPKLADCCGQPGHNQAYELRWFKRDIHFSKARFVFSEFQYSKLEFHDIHYNHWRAKRQSAIMMMLK